LNRLGNRMTGQRAVLLAVVALTLVLPGGAVHAPVPVGGAGTVAHAIALRTFEPPTVRPADPRLASAGSQVRLIVSTTDAMAMPNNGLQLNISPFIEPVLGADTSFQAAVEETIGDHDAVFGLFTNTGTAPIPFFSVFSNTTDSTEHLAYWPTATTAPGSTYDFELVWTNGTTWQLNVNGAIFGGNATEGTFDFGVVDATWLAGLSFSEISLSSSTTSAPATLSTPLAFAVRAASGWYLPDEAQVAFSPSPSAAWGIEGRLQHPTLAPGELVSGTGIPLAVNGTELWVGGRVPVQVVVGAPAGTQGLTTIEVAVTVTTASGAPVPGATIYLSDALGGSFTPSSVLTGSNGSAAGAFSAPNVTANASDLLSAVVTTFGYDGFTDVAVEVAPAVHVIVRALSVGATVGPGGSIVLAFATDSLTGAALPNVFLTLDATSGTLSPSFGLTGSDATLRTTLSAPNTTGFVLVRAEVGSGGEWGASSVNVSVAPPAPSLLTTTDLEVGAGIGVLALAVLVTLALRRRAKNRPPVPPMRFPRRPTVPIAAPPRADDPATRTPGGRGAP
jgi:hypothetical protein